MKWKRERKNKQIRKRIKRISDKSISFFLFDWHNLCVQTKRTFKQVRIDWLYWDLFNSFLFVCGELKN